MDAITSLSAELKARGWQQKAVGKVMFELGCHLALTFGGIALLLVSNVLIIKALALLLTAWGSVGVGSNSHTSSHYATSHKRWINELLTYFGLPFFLQVSATYWWEKHIVAHHSAPNMLGVDDDIDLSPFFAIIDRTVAQSSGIRRRYYRLQWLVLPFAIAANGFNIQVSGWRYVTRKLCDPGKRRVSHWIDLALMILHWGVWIYIPAAFFPFENVAVFYLARMVVLGYAFFFILAPAHFPAEAVCVEKSEGRPDFFLLQTAATVNFQTGFIGRFLCSGLDYQIEHHLFPHISHVHYPKMSHFTREFCKKQGYPYRTLRWREAIWKSFLVFCTPKRVEPRLEAFRLRSRDSGALPMAPTGERNAPHG